MSKEFVPYEEALALKELGFDEPCLSMYMDKELTIIQRTKEELENMMNTPISKLRGTELLLAPLYQQAFRWFREKYDIVSWVSKDKHGFSYDLFNKDYTQMIQDSYKETQDACLRKLIEIVKEK